MKVKPNQKLFIERFSVFGHSNINLGVPEVFVTKVLKDKFFVKGNGLNGVSFDNEGIAYYNNSQAIMLRAWESQEAMWENYNRRRLISDLKNNLPKVLEALSLEQLERIKAIMEEIQ